MDDTADTATKWLQRIAHGDEAALVELYRQYGMFVYSMALRVVNDQPTAEEVTQDVFLSVWHHAKQYDETKGALTTWLLTIARRRAIDYLRRRNGRAPLTILEESHFVVAEDPLPAFTVQSAVADLPPDQQTCIEMLYFKGYTQQEVANELQIPVGTVKGRVRLAMEKLRRILRV
jgi:RNA polymerase sigma factor (sigma-70 family)